MTKSTNQKLKILYLLKILWEKTDEEHYLTLPQLQEELARHEISAERKSLYSDMQALCDFGVDIERKAGRGGGYYIASREFELAELKLLVDGVEVSRFITEKKTRSLIGKLKYLTSVHQARSLQRQVYVAQRIKSMNESIYYNIDAIHNAINQDRQISFRYFEYKLNKERNFRRAGQRYQISPYALTWNDEYYYLIGYEEESGQVKHFRVDKMADIDPCPQRRSGRDQLVARDPAAYAAQLFSMYSGPAEKVRLRFHNRLIGVVLDRFGRDTMVVADGEEHFTIMVEVQLSPQFYGWLFSLGSDATLLQPERAVAEFTAMMRKTAASYQ